ncbi:hypothetical protein ACRDNQ_01755 [Palleronia sp. KMU-117]|uniref:hypothetical protein n=1 Tax=Palleronia sp. KMU-117 TaxID=3434108 RepID=UPI003D7269E2
MDVIMRKTPLPSRRTLIKILLSSNALALSGRAWAQAPSLQDFSGGIAPLPEATIYVAREVITMDPALPRAEAVAVVGDRIAAIGSCAELEALAANQPFRIDKPLSDKVVIAGFVEQHVQPVLAGLTMPAKVISIEPWDTTRGFSDQVREPDAYRARLAVGNARTIEGDET